MAHPRFAVVAGGLRPSSGTVSWPDADSAAVPASPGAPWFAWRLLGGNNRELGRSAQIYVDAQACLAGAASAREAFSSLTATLTADVRRAMWRWRLDAQDGPVAVSSRLYLRQRECSYSLAQFLAGLEVATLWGEAATIGSVSQVSDSSVPLHGDLRGSSAALPSADVVIDLRDPLPAERPARERPRPTAGQPSLPLPEQQALAPLQAGLTTRARQSAEWSRRRYVEARRTSMVQLRSR
jgi:hypothetical protein